MAAITSTPLSRDLGDELRLLRETTTTMNGRDFAIYLGWDPSKVSTIEHGRARATDVDLAQFFTACGKDLHFMQEFQQLYHHAFDPYFAQVTDNLRTLVMTESKAEKITSYEVLNVHGLFQTERYLEAMLTAAGKYTKEEIANFIRLRMDRQTILRRPQPPQFKFYLHELALQMHVGDAKTMEDQYLRLLFNTHHLQIIPAGERALAAQLKCTLYEFDKAEPVAYTDSNVAQVFAQDGAAVAHARSLFEQLDAVALDAEQSKSKLMEYISALREDRNDLGTDLA